MVDTSPFDRAMDVLGHRYRRRLLVELHDSTRGSGVQSAEDAVRRRGSASRTDERDRLRIELVHSHVPKLESYGYVGWDEDTGAVSRGPRWAEIRPLVRLLDDHEDGLPDGWL